MRGPLAPLPVETPPTPPDRHLGPILGLCLLLLASTAGAQRDPWADHPPRIEGASVEVYGTSGEHELRLWIFSPADAGPTEPRPAIVFFFGGGWRAGSPRQFAPQAEYLAQRGMIAVLADYRVALRHGTKIHHAVADAKAVVHHLRVHAEQLGIDPGRLAAGGGSAGGHLAAATAHLPGNDDDPADGSARPDALVLFNPALVLEVVDGVFEPDTERRAGLEERAGVPLESISPYHHLRAGAPPTIIFHGTADRTVAFATAEAHCSRSLTLGNSCELVPYADRGHGFFNHGRNDNGPYVDTVRRMDAFFAALGWLEGEPTIEAASP